MIKIYNKTQNEVVNKVFGHILEVFDCISESEYGKDDEVLEIYTVEDDCNQTTILTIEDWGSTVGGIDFYMKKFWGIN